MKEHEKYVRYYALGPVHREYVRKILYVPHNNSIIASSGDNRSSLIITNINKLKKPYVFRLYKVNKYKKKTCPYFVSIYRAVNVSIIVKN